MAALKGRLMKLTKVLGLRAQLTVLVVLLLAGAVTIGLLTLSGMKDTEEALARVYADRVVPLKGLKQIADMYAVNIVDATHKVRNGNFTAEQAMADIRKAQKVIHEQWAAYLQTTLVADEEQLVREAKPLIAQGDAATVRLLAILERHDMAALAQFAAQDLYQTIDPISEKFSMLVDVQLVAAKAEYDGSTGDYAHHRKLALGTIALALLLGLGTAYLIIRGIMRQLGAEPATSRDIASRIAGGDLTFGISVPHGAETSLLGALAQMKDNLLRSKLEYEGQINAISKAQGVAEMDLDGKILHANENFLRMFGYTLEEVRGKHHSLFLDGSERNTSGYRGLWDKLTRGEFEGGQYGRQDKGGREIWLQSSYNPIVDLQGKPFKVVEYATDITRQRREAQLNAAFKGALDTIGSNVMVASNEGEIIYLNDTAQSLMTSVQADFRKDLPAFDASRLVGTKIDVFHRNPGHQQRMLAALADTYTTQAVIGGRTMRLSANPMKDDTGRRLGTVMEWTDRTQEVRAEQELEGLIRAVSDGELENRIALEGKQGFFRTLSTGLNTLVDNVAEAVKGLQDLVSAANAGDLTQRMPVDGKGGLYVRIGSGVNELTGNMSGVISQVKEAASEVHRGADEISQGNTNLSQRTEEQASSLEETASSMEEMTSTVKQNADNASQASQLALAARDQAEKGGAVVSQAVTAMQGINDASRKIADIIGVIDEIAFQTNLLALNAAVEAARAGEQGRGFAVVATEVRNLAGRSATAAKEIKGLIKDSVIRVEQGSVLVTQSGATLEQIVSAVKKVTDIVAEIAAASQEQSSGIEQVNKAVMQLDELTQQNAALVEEASAASQSMAEQARSLNETMARYRVDATAGSTPALSTAERRGVRRPWAATPVAPRSAPAKATAKATGTDDGVWAEF